MSVWPSKLARERETNTESHADMFKHSRKYPHPVANGEKAYLSEKSSFSNPIGKN